MIGIVLIIFLCHSCKKKKHLNITTEPKTNLDESKIDLEVDVGETKSIMVREGKQIRVTVKEPVLPTIIESDDEETVTKF